MIAACITAKNEAETIGPLVTKLREVIPLVFVVDDGSDNPQTKSTITRLGIGHDTWGGQHYPARRRGIA